LSLGEHGIETLAAFHPELGGLYVIESHRGRGIGTELVRAGMKLALDQGYETVFATTVVAAVILERLYPLAIFSWVATTNGTTNVRSGWYTWTLTRSIAMKSRMRSINVL
jgi:GNAT superfamily N-acetyltransferase